MSSAVIIGVLIVAGSGQSTETAALVAALTEALGPGPSIVVEDRLLPDDSDPQSRGEQLGAVAVVVIEGQPAETTVRIRVHILHENRLENRLIDRRIDFGPGDSAFERGRAIGLAAASILLAENIVPLMAEPRKNEGVGPAIPPGDPGNSTTATTVGAASEPPRPNRFSIDLLALGSMGVPGPAGGLGGVSHVEFELNEAQGIRLGAGVRAGAVAGLGGNDVVEWASLGGTWRPIRTRAIGQFGFAACLDAGVLLHDLSHAKFDGSVAHQTRVQPEASLTLQGSWRGAGRLEVLAALGTEIAFGSTELWVATRRVATLPWVRGLASVGLRFGP